MEPPLSKKCLAVYGTLAPGQRHHELLKPFGGIWLEGTVRGRRFSYAGFPALELDPDGEVVPVKILLSQKIDWALLDAFEGEHYRREVVGVVTGHGVLDCHIYLHRKRPGSLEISGG